MSSRIDFSPAFEGDDSDPINSSNQPHNQNQNQKPRKRRKTSNDGTAAGGGGDKKVHVCDWPGCDKSFSRQDHLSRHKLNHAPTQIYNCDRCNKVFVRADLLVRHVERHERRENLLDSTTPGSTSNNTTTTTMGLDSNFSGIGRGGHGFGTNRNTVGGGGGMSNMIDPKNLTMNNTSTLWGQQQQQHPQPHPTSPYFFNPSPSSATISTPATSATSTSAAPYFPSPTHFSNANTTYIPDPASTTSNFFDNFTNLNGLGGGAGVAGGNNGGGLPGFEEPLSFIQASYGAPFVSGDQYQWLFSLDNSFDVTLSHSRPQSPGRDFDNLLDNTNSTSLPSQSHSQTNGFSPEEVEALNLSLHSFTSTNPVVGQGEEEEEEEEVESDSERERQRQRAKRIGGREFGPILSRDVITSEEQELWRKSVEEGQETTGDLEGEREAERAMMVGEEEGGGEGGGGGMKVEALGVLKKFGGFGETGGGGGEKGLGKGGATGGNNVTFVDGVTRRGGDEDREEDEDGSAKDEEEDDEEDGDMGDGEGKESGTEMSKGGEVESNLNGESNDPSTFVDEPTRKRILEYLGPEWTHLQTDSRTSCKALQKYLYLFWTRVHETQAPAVHRATFRAHKAKTPLVLAMVFLGCFFADSEAHQLAARLHPSFRGKVFCSSDFRPRAELWLHQTALLIIVFGKLCSNRMAHEMAHIFWSSVVTLGRRSAIFSQRPVVVPEELRDDPEALWAAWIEEEVSKRIAHIGFAVDVEHAALFRHSPTLSAFQIQLTLPCDEEEWEATNAYDWVRIHARSRPPVPFISALKASLMAGAAPPVLNPFSRIAILHGLLSVAQDLQWRDHVIGLSQPEGRAVNWRDMVSAAYNSWKSRLDTCLLSASDTTSQLLRASISLYAVAHITLSIDIHELQIFAGAENALGLVVSHQVFEATNTRIRVWAATKDGRAASWHSAYFLRSSLQHYYQSTGDLAGCLHHRWAVYIACLTLYCFGTSTDGKPGPLEVDYQEAGMRYLDSMCTDTPESLLHVPNKNNVLCLVKTILQYIQGSRWEIAQEGARMLRRLSQQGEKPVTA